MNNNREKWGYEENEIEWRSGVECLCVRVCVCVGGGGGLRLG